MQQFFVPAASPAIHPSFIYLVAMEVEPDDIPKAGPTESETANFISSITFAYMGRLIRLGTKRPLQMGCIPSLHRLHICFLVTAGFKQLQFWFTCSL